MKIKSTLLLLTCILFFSIQGNSQGFLHTEGTSIVNENGDNVLLRGMGLGGWMLQEGYMLQTAGFASAQYQIKGKIEELIGAANTDVFYETWLDNHVQKADIDSLKSWGFNSVRLPMHYNLFTLPIEEEPVENVNTWLDRGFELTDSLISWCKQNEMYVILDLHAAPGGQGYDQAISDYDPTKPSIWESALNRNKAASLWKRIANRYVDEPWVAGYDLLNEPNWDLPGNNVLRNVYWQITDSIRAVDNNHIIFIEGNWFANDFTNLTPPWDDNMVYSPHKYWSVNDQASIQWVLDIRNEHNVPLYLGESGENSNTWFRDAIHLLENHNIGWAWWPMKKVESISGPLSIIKSDDYTTLLDYWNNGGTVPSAAFAEAALMELAENTKIEHCIFQKDVIDAMFRQVATDEAIPFNGSQNIPGIVYATDFDLGVVGSAYFDTDVGNYSVTTGNYTGWNNGWAYRNDGVDIEATVDNVNSNGYAVGFMSTGEWMQYDVNVASEAVYDVEVRLAAGADGGLFHLSANGADISNNISVSNTGGWQSWETITFSDLVLDPSISKLRFHVDQEGYNLGSLNFIQVGPSNSVATNFVSGITTDENTIQISLNKAISGPLPASPANFIIFVNGSSVPVTNAEINNNNSRLIDITVNHEFKASEDIKASYTGTQITAEDGTSLSTFSLRPIQNTIIEVHAIPGKVEAEGYFVQSGTVLENTSDVGGGQNIGYLDAGDYLDYYVDVSQAGLYQVEYRTAAESASGEVQMQVVDDNGNTNLMHNVTFPPTGGWQTWGSTNANVVFFTPGQKHIRISITQPLFNMNWFEFSFLTATNEVNTQAKLHLFPNPNDGHFSLTGNLSKQQNVKIQVFNILGNLMVVKDLEDVNVLSENLNLSGFADGNYFVRILLEDGTQMVEKVVKMD